MYEECLYFNVARNAPARPRLGELPSIDENA